MAHRDYWYIRSLEVSYLCLWSLVQLRPKLVNDSEDVHEWRKLQTEAVDCSSLECVLYGQSQSVNWALNAKHSECSSVLNLLKQYFGSNKSNSAHLQIVRKQLKHLARLRQWLWLLKVPRLARLPENIISYMVNIFWDPSFFSVFHRCTLLALPMLICLCSVQAFHSLVSLSRGYANLPSALLCRPSSSRRSCIKYLPEAMFQHIEQQS